MPKHPFPLHVVNAIKGQSTALVVGGAGFLGSHLCERLLERCEVICLDNLHFGKRENIEALRISKKFSFIEYDITRPIADLLRKKVDYIFYLAGIDEATATKKASLDDLLLNTYGTRNLLEKSVSDKAKFLLVSTLEHEKTIDDVINTAQARLVSENITREYIARFGINARIIRLGHLFGPRMPFNTENPMSVLIRELLERKEIVLANDELTRVYPVFIDEAVAVLLEIMFGQATAGKIFNLIPSQSITLLELSHIFKDVDAQFNLRFDQEGKKIHVFAKENFRGGTTISMNAKIDIVDQLKATFFFFEKGRGKSFYLESIKKTPLAEKTKKESLSRRLGAMLFIGMLVLIITIMPFLFLGIVSALGLVQLNSTYKAIQEGNFSAASQRASFARGFFASSQNTLRLLSYHFSLFRRQQDQNTLFLIFKGGEDAGFVSENLVNATTLLGEFFKKSLKGEGRSAKPALDGAIGELNAASQRMPILEKELEEVASRPLPRIVGDYVRGKQALLSEYRETISLAQVLASLLPDLLGFDDKRTYLVLFQNNMELRPSGGFIGSYGILTFEKGSFSSFDVFDVYAADGQLKGHVDPPVPIRKYLNQPNWFLRDSNWDPDFQKAAAQASWFLQKEVGIVPHGVIAVDVSFAQFLLEAVGPISLPDYKETITKDNLFEKAEAHSEIGFFPGSTQKKDFLGVLNRRIIDNLLHGENTPWIGLLSALKKALRQKHILFSFQNPAAQQVFNLNNWGGTILTFEEKEGTFFDYRMVNEANLGVNKANFFVKRKISDEIIIGKEGEIKGRLSIGYTNDGPPTWPGGTYVNYLRVFFPQAARVTAIEIDGEEVSINAEKKPFEIDETTQTFAPGQEKTVFGFPISVASRTSKLVTFVYTLPKPFPLLPGSSTYVYIFQKQPGTLVDALNVMIHYPQILRIKNTNAQVFQEKQVVTLSTDLSEDRLFKVEFVK